MDNYEYWRSSDDDIIHRVLEGNGLYYRCWVERKDGTCSPVYIEEPSFFKKVFLKVAKFFRRKK